MTETPEQWRERVGSIGVVGKLAGKPRVGVSETPASRVVTTEHWDGRQDATVYPDVIRHGARFHKTGSKKGQVAEIHKMTDREKKERYGD